jgi:hypothetical protein
VNLGTLRTEVQARGFDYLSNARLDAYINRAYLDLADSEDWPWLEATTSGTAPLTISDLRTIESVRNSTQSYRLAPLDRRNIMHSDDDLATTGTPSYYYLTTGTTVAVYPANTSDTIAVRYWKVPTELSVDSDTPAVPTRYHQLLVDGAVVYAYVDSDNFQSANEVLTLVETQKARMREALLVGQHDAPDDYIHVLADSEDW